ncbi:uncharacterized protein LOC129899744 [Solanum dulcamara]|uniref:uncharacterized protein LOC129899744 n=1 Tax=Solanum dulcamara TaxID=45834 RepID=UPI00248557B6|nr:uncharacterized protein LOC129899744 [Solanum dulcamara]
MVNELVVAEHINLEFFTSLSTASRHKDSPSLMKSTSSSLLDLEGESKGSPSSFESKLLFCNGGSDLQSRISKFNPTVKKPEISSTSQSQVLEKVKNFLGVLSEANKKLEVDAKKNPKKYDIKELTREDSEYIEMNLMLGVAEVYSFEAVAAAESVIARQQPLTPLASISSATTDVDDSSNEDGR